VFLKDKGGSSPGKIFGDFGSIAHQLWSQEGKLTGGKENGLFAPGPRKKRGSVKSIKRVTSGKRGLTTRGGVKKKGENK